MNNPPTQILGVMSGSSLDGLDMAIIAFEGLPSDEHGVSYHWVDTFHRPISEEWVAILRSAPTLSASELLRVHVQFSDYVARSIRKAVGELPFDLVGWHGHTVFHDPDGQVSFQLGKGSALAHALGTTTVADFREYDLYRNGQGAPLAPLVDRHFFRTYRAAINLGGIANMTLIDEGRAMDICGCNQVLNYLAQKLGSQMDEDGRLSQKGALHPELVQKMNQWDYLQRPAPKSLGNEAVQNFYFPILNAFDGKVEDAMQSFIEHLTRQIAAELSGFANGKVLVTGGGAHHPGIIEKLREKCPGLEIVVPDGPWVDYKEAFLMAYLAYLRSMKQPNIIASTTGSSEAAIAGTIYCP